MIETKELEIRAKYLKYIMLTAYFTSLSVTLIFISLASAVFTVHYDIPTILIFSIILSAILTGLTLYSVKKCNYLSALIENFNKLEPAERIIESIKIIIYVNVKLPMLTRYIKFKCDKDVSRKVRNCYEE